MGVGQLKIGVLKNSGLRYHIFFTGAQKREGWDTTHHRPLIEAVRPKPVQTFFTPRDLFLDSLDIRSQVKADKIIDGFSVEFRSHLY